MSVVPRSLRAAVGAAIVVSGGAACGGTETGLPADPVVARGRELTVQLGCTACHSPGTTDTIGPAWGGSWGSTVDLADGSTVVFDAAYVTSAVRTPAEQRRAGDWIQMPAYPGALLTDDDLAAVIAYLESLSTP
jgi:cytochrome c oxidase subunit 2